MNQIKVKFAVITRVPDPETDNGNLAASLIYWDKDQPPPIPLDQAQKIKLLIMLHGRSPVFTLGEILVLDSESGREVSGAGRKPSKWDVEVEFFDTIEQAINRAVEITQLV